MELGCVTDWTGIGRAAQAGFDFVAVCASEVLQPGQSTGRWESWVRQFMNPPLPTRVAVDCEFEGAPSGDPSHESHDMIEVQNHIQRIAKRAERLGIGVLVWEAGSPMVSPATLDEHSTTDSELFLMMAGQVCAHHDVLFSVQVKVKGSEVNDKVCDVHALCERVAHRCVRVGLDFTELTGVMSGYRNLLPAGSLLGHVMLPINLDEAAEIVPVLRGVGYDGPLILPTPVSGTAVQDLRVIWHKDCRRIGRY